MNILEAIADANLFRATFGGESWSNWHVLLKAIFALPLEGAELEVFQRFAGDREPPLQPVSECGIVAGRRSGKSSVAALLSVFLGCFHDWRPHLAGGEVATVALIASDRLQSRNIMNYCRGLFQIPLLENMVEEQLRESIQLKNRVRIEVRTASYRTVRGYSLAACICDELAFWRSEETGANPAAEVLAALRPGLASLPKSLLFVISSPHSRSGELYKMYRRYYGRSDPETLIWKAPTSEMNPTLPARVIESAYSRDPEAARSEYGAEFRRDLATYAARDQVEALAVPDRRSLPPAAEVEYSGFVDPSGGRADSFSLCIGHREGETVVLDLLAERRPPFSPKPCAGIG